ncbi:hypothetical protein [Dyadobacter frigoris]|uniref:Cupin n=1 Tax=Dyadobacter frigoris TaxID=2576211 RepID=A0A4U6D9A2_9BACT|nr:hypothetical protein [Dyadobacter frigoris]TKT92857.1 hypothetical protein FDK13_08690 [Dyadobacter frigoris]GLU54373.1 hypothetical protein Dfri01_38340 [Dyadobacter frigoris]
MSVIIKNVLNLLETATIPVVKIIQSNENFKAILIALKKGMVLKEHKTTFPTRLLVMEGSVVYKTDITGIFLHKHDDLEIPVHLLHSLEANEDSLCLLIQG